MSKRRRGTNDGWIGRPPPAFAKASAGKPALERRLSPEALAKGDGFMKYVYLIQSLAVPDQHYRGGSAEAVPPPNRSAARSLSCRFHSVIWLGCTSNRWASSASVFSPPIAASATLALNTAECVHLVRVAIVCSLSSPCRGINGSRFSTYRLAQISGATSPSRRQMSRSVFRWKT